MEIKIERAKTLKQKPDQNNLYAERDEPVPGRNGREAEGQQSLCLRHYPDLLFP